MCMVDDLKKSEDERKHQIECSLEKLRSRIDATEVSAPKNSLQKKETGLRTTG